MKVLVVCLNGDHPRTGYAARVLSNIKSLLADHNDVSVLRLTPAFHKNESWADALIKIGVKEFAEVPVPPLSRFKFSRFMTPIVGWLWLFAFWLKWRPNLILAEGHEAASVPLLFKYAKVLVDIHGAGPEEAEYVRLQLGSRDLSIVSWLNHVEKVILKKADRIFVVTPAMEKHLCRKWAINSSAQFRVLPVALGANFLRDGDCNVVHKYSLEPLINKNVFVYCGGVQAYQCVDDTIANYICIARHIKDPALLFITPDAEKIRGKVDRLSDEIKNSIVIVSATPDEVPSLLKLGKYGFVLRENNVLNIVACPTKINEYLACGLVLICTESAGHGSDAINRTGAGVLIPLQLEEFRGSEVAIQIQKCYQETQRDIVLNYLRSFSGPQLSGFLE